MKYSSMVNNEKNIIGAIRLQCLIRFNPAEAERSYPWAFNKDNVIPEQRNFAVHCIKLLEKYRRD